MNPILYSFRRCPYAIRARIAVHYCEAQVEVREVILRDKPQAMLDISPKGTVPVLQLADGTVIEESREIIDWALAIADVDDWSLKKSPALCAEAEILIEENDGTFKTHLDRYKYADRFPERSAEDYRAEGEVFLAKLEKYLSKNKYLFADRISYADIAIFPFVRQFAFVDKDWFDQTPYSACQRWLAVMLASELFTAVMQKRVAWQLGAEPVLLR